MTTKTNLLDLMTEEERSSVKKAYAERMTGNVNYRKSLKVPPEIFLLSELGYFFGWGAIQDAKRGYVEDFDEITGKRRKIPLTMEEINILVEGARKVWYGKAIDTSRATQTAVGSVMSKHPDATFKKGIKPFQERAKI